MLNIIKEFLNLGYYTSPLGKFLAEFDRTHPKRSLSQHQEMEKYEKISQLRDYPHESNKTQPSWENF